MIIEENKIINLNGVLYYWESHEYRYISLVGQSADTFIRLKTPEEHKGKINKHAIEEILQWIKTDKTLFINANKIKQDKYIAFKNGVYNIKKDKLLWHDPKLLTFNVLNANYNEMKFINSQGEHFEQFMLDITDDNAALYNRFQELFGYIISNIRDIKCIPFFIGTKDTGKSIVLKLLEYIIGTEACTNISIEQLNKQEYVADLLGKKLNACGELGELKLNRLDTLKKLSGGDMIAAKPLYQSPIYFKNTAALVFAGNHLPSLKGLDKESAFSKRLVIFPFLNQIPKEKQDIKLFDKLIKEVDYITTWAIDGLKRWMENNYQFTTYKGLIKIEQRYAEQTNSIENFIKDVLAYDVDSKIHRYEIDEAYLRYCNDKSLAPEDTKELHNHLKLDIRLTPSRFRKNGQNKHGYIGLNSQE